MNHLIFDTETTGFPLKGEASNSPRQARIVQLAALLLDDEWNELGSIYSLVKPNGWSKISEGASKAHGITVADCEAKGRCIKNLLDEFMELSGDARMIAHNSQFDDTMLQIEFDNYIPLTRIKSEVCTMEWSTGICKLPHKTARNFGSKYKWPKLEEAYLFFFNENMTGAHDALSDVRACARIYRHLVTNYQFMSPNKLIKQPIIEQQSELNV